MKIYYLSCTKMLYFAERLLEDGISQIPLSLDDDGDFAKQFGMTNAEVSEICDQFEHDKLLKLDSISVEGENNYGEMNSEFDYEALRPNKIKLQNFVESVKVRYGLRQKPFLTREAILSISTQIEKTFKKDEWLRAVLVFSKGGTFSSIKSGQYTLTDFLFRHAYMISEKFSLSLVLAEFLNPTYYGIEAKGTEQKLFEYMDKVLLVNTKKKTIKNGVWQQISISPLLKKMYQQKKCHCC